jgi:hypothetical protein
MPNTVLNKVSNNINQIPKTLEDEHNEFLFNLIEEIHKKYGFTRSKL